MMFLRLLTLALTAMVLVPSGAHLFEMPHKITLDREAYFTIQAIYAGWAWFVIPIIAAIVLNGALMVSHGGLVYARLPIKAGRRME